MVSKNDFIKDYTKTFLFFFVRLGHVLDLNKAKSLIIAEWEHILAYKKQYKVFKNRINVFF